MIKPRALLRFQRRVASTTGQLGPGPGAGGAGTAGDPTTKTVTGVVRLDHRTKSLLERLRPGEVAVIDHQDLDRLAAESLLRARPAAVVNVAESISGRYPNMGPLLVVAAGIPLVDGVGSQLFDHLVEGELVSVSGSDILHGGQVVGRGRVQTLQSLEDQISEARLEMGGELERFAANTLAYLRTESHLLTDTPDLPDLGVDLRGRHVLVAVRGPGSEDDLRALRAYIGEVKPVMVGVDGGADLLMAAGYRPQLIIGDFDSVSDATLGCGAELVVHAYPDGSAPGAARLGEIGLNHSVFAAVGTSEDIALLLAYEKGAELIVAVGTHASMVEFLDKGREGMASTFLVRLKVGPILVDAKGVSKLYESRVRTTDMVILVAAALFAVVVIATVAEPIRTLWDTLWLILVERWNSLWG